MKKSSLHKRVLSCVMLVISLFFVSDMCQAQDCTLTSNAAAFNGLCDSSATGAVEVESFGGTPLYEYTLIGADGLYMPNGENNLFDALYPGTYIVITTDQNNCIVRDTVTVSAITVDKWTGSQGDNLNLWSNSQNWNMGVPTACADVVIPAGSTVVLDFNTTVKSLTVSPNASFTVQAGDSLTITH